MKIEIKAKKYTAGKEQLLENVIELLIKCHEADKILPECAAILETMVFLENYAFYLLESEYPQEFIVNMFEAKREYYRKIIENQRKLLGINTDPSLN